MSRRYHLPSLVISIVAIIWGCAAPVRAQSLSMGFSLDTASGAPAAAWQSVDARHNLACRLSLAPTAPGCSGSLAGSQAIAGGKWLVTGDLAASSYGRLSASSGDIGLAFTPAPTRAGLLQATIGLGFAGGNGVAWNGGLWPVAHTARQALSAGLRWAPASLVSLHMTARSIRSGLPISEQEVGLDTAITPALLLSLGATAQQSDSAGFVTSAALRWQPRPESALAFNLEADLARSFRSGPLPGEPFDTEDAAGAGPRLTGQIASASVEAPISDALHLRVGASLPMGLSRTVSPSWMVSVSHGL